MHAWFLEIVSSMSVGVRMCVCPLQRALITSHVKGKHNNWIRQFYDYSVHYMTLAIDKLNRRGLSNAVHHECPPKKTRITQY